MTDVCFARLRTRKMAACQSQNVGLKLVFPASIGDIGSVLVVADEHSRFMDSSYYFKTVPGEDF